MGGGRTGPGMDREWGPACVLPYHPALGAGSPPAAGEKLLGERGSSAGKMKKVFERWIRRAATGAKRFLWESLCVPITGSLDLFPGALGKGC